MSSQKLTKELADQLMKNKGEARGTHFVCDALYIKKRKGKKGLEKVEEKLKELGYPFDYSKVNNMDFYPVGLRALSLLAMKEVFGWTDKDIEENCANAAKYSFIIKVFARYFFSIRSSAKFAPKIWREYFTSGNLEVAKVDLEKKEAVFQIKNFKLHPVFCQHCFVGFMKEIVRMVINVKDIKCKKTSCVFKNSNICSLTIIWQ